MALFLFVQTLLAASPASPIVINEIMWDGTEYVELRNVTDTSVPLDGWQLLRRRAGEAAETIVTFVASDSVPASGYFLLEKSEAATTVVANKLVSGLTLLNTGEQLILKNSSGDTIDTANGSGEWLAGENTDAGVAMERNDEPGDGTNETSWHSATTSLGGRDGTPGAANSVPAVNEAPNAVAGLDVEVDLGESVTLSGDDSSDPDDDELTYSWDLGDSTTSSGKTVTHTYQKTGTFTVTLTVNDGELTDTDALTVAVASPSYSDSIVISEFLPDPTGSDTTSEFIELQNTGSAAVNVGGWKLDDADGGSSPYTIPTDTRISGGGYLSFSRSETKVALNNTGDSVRLLSPDGKVKASVTYGSEADEGQSYNRSGSSLKVSTTVTPGQANVITEPDAEEEDKDEDDEEGSTRSSSKKTGSVAGTSATTVVLKNIRSEKEGEIVQTEGVVSTPPGVFGERVMYLAGSGIQVYLSAADYPDVAVGQTVKVVGELSSYQGEARLKLASNEDVTVMQKAGVPPEPHVLKTGDIDEEVEGWLVTIQGKVTQTSGNTFYVDDDSGKVKVFIKESTGIDKPPMKKGEDVTITGVVSRTTSGYRILPRFQEDLHKGRVAGLKHFPATGAQLTLVFWTVVALGTWGWWKQEPLLRKSKV